MAEAVGFGAGRWEALISPLLARDGIDACKDCNNVPAHESIRHDCPIRSPVPVQSPEFDLSKVGKMEDVESMVRQSFKKKKGLWLSLSFPARRPDSVSPSNSG